MFFYTYILYSTKIDRYYIGYSSDPKRRLENRHNKGKVKSTRRGAPYKLVALKKFDSRMAARKEELRLKKSKNRNYLEWLSQGNW